MFLKNKENSLIKKYTSQFWIGTFDSEKRFNEFVGEDPDYWSEENEDNDDIPLNKFISSQNETWFDHDFIEAGYNAKEGSVLEKFGSYSYVNQWANAVSDKMTELGLDSINAFIMMGIDQPPNGSRYLQVSNPCSFKSEGIDLVYIGEYEYSHDFSWLEK
jgi:hypothetical protein